MSRSLRTFEPPRFRDSYSFSGRGRQRFQEIQASPRDGQIEGVGPVHDGQPVPVRG